MSHYRGTLQHLREGNRNLLVGPDVKSGLLFDIEVLLRVLNCWSQAEVERDEACHRVSSLWAVLATSMGETDGAHVGL